MITLGIQMKTLLATAILLTSTSAFAHDTHNDCDVDIHAGVSIAQHDIAFYKSSSHKGNERGKLLYKIVDDNTLLINAEKISLTASQKALIHDYSTSIRAVIPEVKSVAIEGIDLAVDGITMAFDELLGKNNDVTSDLTNELSKIRSKIDNRFSGNQTIYFDEHGFDGEDFFDEDFESHIEAVVENAVKKSMGSLLIAVGKEMLFSGGDSDALEARMEKFGDEIESKMEFKAANIEKRADGLCQSLVSIDKLEQQLQSNIPQLKQFNVLTVSKDNHKSI